MELHLHILLTLFLIYNADFIYTEHCVIDVGCTDCLPDHMPDFVSHTPKNDLVTVYHGDEATLHCHQTKFKSYPDKNSVRVVCENGYFSVVEDSVRRHITELGCQTSYFEDIPHSVDMCMDGFQGRSYQYHNSVTSKVEHLAELCYDPLNKRAVFARMTPANFNNIEQNKEHGDDRYKPSMLENFSRMYDTSNRAEMDHVYFDDAMMDKKMKSLFGNKKFDFADQSLVVTKLLTPKLYKRQKGGVTNFSTNKMASWKSVSNGNFKNAQMDVIDKFCSNETNGVDIFVGTHDVVTLSTRSGPHRVFLKPNFKYPVPKYLYTIVHDKLNHRAVAIVTVNNPFIPISEIKDLILCTSVCSQISWLHNLKSNNNYERPIYGLTLCCDLHTFSGMVPDAPNILSQVKIGEEGLLKD